MQLLFMKWTNNLLFVLCLAGLWWIGSFSMSGLRFLLTTGASEQRRMGLASSALAGVGGWGVVVVPTGGFCANQDGEEGTLLV